MRNEQLNPVSYLCLLKFFGHLANLLQMLWGTSLDLGTSLRNKKRVRLPFYKPVPGWAMHGLKLLQQLRLTSGAQVGFPPCCGLFHLGLVVVYGSKQEKKEGKSIFVVLDSA